MDSGSLAGKKALVIGAGTPPGRAIAVALAEAGADVAVAASSLDGEEVMACRRTRRAVERLGRRSAEYAFDVTLGQNVQVSTRQVVKEMGGIDILVYAVHGLLDRPADKLSDAEWSRLLALNVSGAFYACRAALREMLAAGGGRILLVATAPGRGQGSVPAMEHVVAGAIAGLTRGIAAEFGERSIRAYCLVVGGDEQASLPDLPAERGRLPADLGALAVALAAPAGEGENGGVYPAALQV